MGWDPALMRKYNNTGHFRLLNQLRSELKAHPIQRETKQAADVLSTAPTNIRETRSRDVQAQTYAGGRSRRSTSTVNFSNKEYSKDQNSSSSFRDRLNAIEMR
jgi:hypothetical protein